MNGSQKTPGEYVTSVTVQEVIVSCGVQLVNWAHELAFTDAAFGETWAMETADRMASLSEILNVVYKRLPARTLGIVIELPPGMLGQVAINPGYDPKAEEASSDDKASTERKGGVDTSIGDFPF
jgi:hypothetical protein